MAAVKILPRGAIGEDPCIACTRRMGETIKAPNSAGPQGMSPGHGSQFTAKMEKAVVALMNHHTGKEAAQAAGISESTLKRWRQVPQFQEAYWQMRREALEETTARLQQYADAASTMLLKTMADTVSPASVRLSAADSVLRMAERGLQLEGLNLRIAAVQRAMATAWIGQPACEGVSRPMPVRAEHGRTSHRLEAAAASLLMHRKIEEAAKTMGVSVRTLQRWKKLPEFQGAWMAARRAVMFEASARLQRSVGAAAAVLRQVMTDVASKPGLKVRAAKSLLEHAYQGLAEDLERQVSALERAIDLRKDEVQNLPKAA